MLHTATSDDAFLLPLALDEKVVAQLGLSVLIDLGGLREVLISFYHSSSADRLLGMLGLPKSLMAEDDRLKLIQAVKARHAELGSFTGSFGTVLDESLQYLSDTLGLAATERRVLGLATTLNAHECLAKLTSKGLGELDFLRLIKVSSTLLGDSESEIRAALAPNSLLVRSGLLGIDRTARQRLHQKFALLDGLVEALCGGPEEIRTLLERWIPSAPASTLRLTDYPHRRREITLMRRILKAALRSRRSGVNILVYGPPGTGKSELMRALAVALDVPLYAVPTADEMGDPLSGDQRLRYYRLAQTVLSRRDQALLLFDEVEDVFPHPIGIRFGNATLTKGWINAALEENALPTLWVCNGIDGLDPAYLRRFAQVIEVGIPPVAVRERLVQTQTRDLPVSRAWQQRTARHPELSPALLRQAVNSVAMADYRRPETAEVALDNLLNTTLKAMGKAPLPQPLASEVMRYRPECLNTDQDLHALEQGLRRDPRGRICCYGPPGTGKSAYGIHLARALQRPLLIKRASDLLNLYVGETEKNLAGMFREAETEGAVLLLDEADSFLRDRREARNTWEVTQVNELLVQMENFDGVFIVSTNLFESLDAAALRRFDLKIRFDYLRPEQTWTLFRETLRQTSGRLTQPTVWQARLSTLEQLTPGDFAAVVRRQRLATGRLSPQGLFDALSAEVQTSSRITRRSIGFSASL